MNSDKVVDMDDTLKLRDYIYLFEVQLNISTMIKSDFIMWLFCFVHCMQRVQTAKEPTK